MRYAALKATEYQCTVECLSLDSKHISLPMHELKFPVHILAAHARNILCGPSIFSQHSGVHVLGLALLRHLSMIWVQARQITSLPLIYITLLGLHTLFLEVYDQKDITGEEKKKQLCRLTKRICTIAAQVQSLTFHVNFLRKANDAQCKQIWKQKTIIAKQTATIQRMTAKLKAKKPIKATKSMKAQ